MGPHVDYYYGIYVSVIHKFANASVKVVLSQYMSVLTAGKSVTSSFPARLDLTNDLTSPLCIYGSIINGRACFLMILTPIRPNTFGWSSCLAIIHSLINSSVFAISVATWIQDRLYDYCTYMHTYVSKL